MKTMALVFVAGVMLLGPEAVKGNTKAAAVPGKVLAARKIYVENRTNDVELQNDTYLELAKWGRFQIVDSAKKADVVLRLTGGSSAKMVPTGERTYLYNSSVSGAWQDREEQVPGGFTRLTLFDPKTGSALWSDQRKTLTWEAKRQIVDGLRDAIDRGEKSRSK